VQDRSRGGSRALIRNLADLQRLAKRIEDLRLEFRQFVEEEHAMMRERDSPGRARKPPPTSAGMLAEWCGARTDGNW